VERVLEPEVMDSAEETDAYDAMDHTTVNEIFVRDLLAAVTPGLRGSPELRALDLGTGTARIPILLCKAAPSCRTVAVDLAWSMLCVGARNVRSAGLARQIHLLMAGVGTLPFRDGTFGVAMSNSLIHHLPSPAMAFREMVRVCAAGGVVFVRDLARPDNEATLAGLVATYAGSETAPQRALFDASLRAALTLAEVRAIVDDLGFDPGSVALTSDRHWTFVGTRG
jgi:ubiquinone/menaquinone biosynthesis C-methylase UbiE